MPLFFATVANFEAFSSVGVIFYSLLAVRHFAHKVF